MIAVRGGGHSLPGFSTCDGGLVIDLRPMNQVSVDPVTRRAAVGGGALLRDLDQATQRHGLVVPAGVISHTGVAGLTLGGGVGRLMRRFGLTIDSLRAAEVVTADGRILRADADQHPDLFWAIRGGGGNFGVVTEFEFALHELSQLTVLRMYHEMAGAHRVLGRAQQVIAGGAPDELLWTSFARKAAPLPWMPASMIGRPGIVSVIEWSGEPDAGQHLLTALRDDLGPVASELSVVPFAAMQTEGDEFFGPGLLSYVKATFAAGLSPDLIDVVIAQGQRLGSEVSQIELLSLGGAITRVAPEATAFPHRDAGWLINIPASWRSPGDTDKEVQLGPGHVRRPAAGLLRRRVRELHGPRRAGRRPGRLRRHAAPAAAGQGGLRPRQRVPAEPEHHPGGRGMTGWRTAGPLSPAAQAAAGPVGQRPGRLGPVRRAAQPAAVHGHPGRDRHRARHPAARPRLRHRPAAHPGPGPRRHGDRPGRHPRPATDRPGPAAHRRAVASRHR